MRGILRTFIILTGLIACASEPAPPDDLAGQDRSEIQGGVAFAGERAVGLLLYRDGGYCTASLVAPNVVLTAAHCVSKPLRAFMTTNGSPTPTEEHAVAEVRRAPWYIDLWCPNPTNDVAVVRLAEPIDDIAPLRFGAAPPPRGTSCTAVGFGIHDTENGSTERKRKRMGRSVIDNVSGGAIRVEYETAIADEGDSGGPLLCGGSIVGTVGCHNDDDWPEHRVEYYERTDEVASFIREAIDDWRGRR